MYDVVAKCLKNTHVFIATVCLTGIGFTKDECDVMRDGVDLDDHIQVVHKSDTG